MSNAIPTAINAIASPKDFADWLKSFLDLIRDSPESFSHALESINWLRDIKLFAIGNHPGYFNRMIIPVPDSPQNWQLLAHAIYTTYPVAG
jgi:hypothetical protein